MLTDPTMIVGIGGSAGGLKAYISLLESLPDKTGMAFVIIAHMSPNAPSLLTELLTHKTLMPVTQAEDGMPTLANQVYVIAPNNDLMIEDYHFKVMSPRTMNQGRHRQVDCFLSSLAESMQSRAIGIILSGGDGDGTEGCRSIRANGGITFAQDLSADVDSMPLHAQASGCVDFVLNPKDIAGELVRISQLNQVAGVKQKSSTVASDHLTHAAIGSEKAALFLE